MNTNRNTLMLVVLALLALNGCAKPNQPVPPGSLIQPKHTMGTSYWLEIRNLEEIPPSGIDVGGHNYHGPFQFIVYLNGSLVGSPTYNNREECWEVQCRSYNSLSVINFTAPPEIHFEGACLQPYAPRPGSTSYITWVDCH